MKNLTEFDAKYYPQCYDPISKLCKDNDYGKEVNNAVVGAISGALIGALIGAATGKSENIAAGAAIGAGVGLVGGFVKARIEKIQDQDERLNELHAMLGEESETLDLEKSSVQAALKCYSKEIDRIKAAVKKKKMTKQEATDRMNEIKIGLANLKEFWKEKSAVIDSHVKDYDAFIAAENRKNLYNTQRAQLQEAQQKTLALKQDTDRASEQIASLENKLMAAMEA